MGCNIGYFAGLAAAHGARVECFEAAPLWAEAASRLAALNGWAPNAKAAQAEHQTVARSTTSEGGGSASDSASSITSLKPTLSAAFGAIRPGSSLGTDVPDVKQARPRFTVHNVAMTANVMPGNLDFHNGAYKPCRIAQGQPGVTPGRGIFSVPTLDIVSVMLRNGHVTILKVDIDSIEGALLHVVTNLIEAKNITVCVSTPWSSSIASCCFACYPVAPVRRHQQFSA